MTCGAPNMSRVLQSIVSQNPGILPKTQTFRREGYFPVEGRLNFVDKAVAELRKKDQRWKYAWHHGAAMSEYIAYACSGDPTDAVFIEVVRLARFSNPRVSGLIWRNQTQAHGRHPGYKAIYPRPGGGDLTLVTTEGRSSSGGSSGGGSSSGGSSGGGSSGGGSSSGGGGTGGGTRTSAANAETALSNAKGIVERLKREHSNAWNVAQNSFQGSYGKDAMEFLDRTVQKLNAKDPRFGYVRPDGRKVNPRAFCYSVKSSPPYMGSRSGNGENWHVDFVPEPGHGRSLIWVKRPAGWSGFEGSIDSCIYPRPGASDYGYGGGEPAATGGTSPAPPSTTAAPTAPSTAAATPASTPAATTAAQPAPTDCRSLRVQIPELQRRLDEQMKAYRGKRQKKWLGLKRNSCKNVQLCETLAGAIHLAASNPSMASRLGHYKKQFGKNCKDFERCRAITGEIEQIRKDLDASVRAYNRSCRS